MDSRIIDCTGATFEEKELLLGKGFGLINVVSFHVVDGVILTTVIIDEKKLVLVGDPEKALHNYMLGEASCEISN